MNAAVAADSPFTGDILVCAPHMDDDALGCGMLIAMHASKGRVHALFVSDGALSPEPAPGRPDDSRGLPAIRELEARAGLEILGVPQANITFLGLPDGALAHHEESIAAAVTDQARAVGARAVLVPFRYDRHPDHLALNRAATAAHAAGGIAAELVEYFVYTRWRMLRSRDVRDYVCADDLLRVHSADAARRKRAALGCHRSQTTLFFPGQRRPILSEALIDEACEQPEAFLFHRAGRGGRRGLARGRYWVPLACKLEPALKRLKDRVTGGGVQ